MKVTQLLQANEGKGRHGELSKVREEVIIPQQLGNCAFHRGQLLHGGLTGGLFPAGGRTWESA